MTRQFSGLSHDTPDDLERVWSTIGGAAGPATAEGPEQKKFNWPAMALFMVIISTPLLIMKLINKMTQMSGTTKQGKKTIIFYINNNNYKNSEASEGSDSTR